MAGKLHSDGLSFKKLDLHVHTPASSCFADRAVTAQQIVDSAVSAGLAGLAITDHNSAAFVDLVKDAARGKGIVVFPGVEISCGGGKKGLHVIALFDPSQGKSEVEGLLSELKLTPNEFGKEETLVKMSCSDVLRIIRERGALGALAHANSTHGALMEMEGQQRIALLRDHNVCAVEGTDFVNDERMAKKARVADLLDGTNESFPKLAVYQASDNPLNDGSGRHGLEGIGTRCAFFKMDTINLEGLRQCFYDTEVRIRQDFELVERTYPYIVRVSISSGFLENAVANFHPGLNSIIGGKGAGKSLLVEFLRFALGQQPENPEIRADHDLKLDERLQEYGTVEVVMADETGKEFAVKRTLSDSQGSPFDKNSRADIARLFPVLFLSQNEIIKVAESTEQQVAFIDQFFDFRSYTSAITRHETDLVSFDKEYADCLRARTDAASLQQSLQAFGTELSKLNSALKNPVFEDFQRLELKENALIRQQSAIAELVQLIDTTKNAIKQGAIPEIPESLSEDPALKRSRKVATDAKQNTLAGLESIASEIRKAQGSIIDECTNWRPTFDAGKSKYEGTVRKEGGDYKILAAKREKVMKESDIIGKRHAIAKQRADRIKGVADARNAKLTELWDTYAAYSAERQAKCKKLELESGGRLKITLHEATDREAFRQRLLALKRGSYLRDAEVDAVCKGVDSSEVVKSIIAHSLKQDSGALAEIASRSGIDFDRMRTLAEFLLGSMVYEELLQLQYKAMPEDRPEIRYCVGEDLYEPIDHLSVGQKCTAMLIMALSDGMMPVVIDQPEDSLDIRSVWEDMCTKIRNGKEQRQFIFTTHNASLAVASDTDKFIVLEGGATRGEVKFSGSMDHVPVSDEVLKYLEGGPETYKMKSRKYDIRRKSKEI